MSCSGAVGRPLAIGKGHSIFRLRNISRAQLPCKERRTDTKIEKFYAMVNHNLEFLETSSRIWCCLAGARQQKRLSAGRNHHRATTKYHQKVHSFYEHQRIQACQNNLALTSEISGNFVNDKNPALFPSLPCFESSSAVTAVNNSRTILIGLRCLQRADRTPSNIFFKTAVFPIEAVTQNNQLSHAVQRSTII